MHERDAVACLSEALRLMALAFDAISRRQPWVVVEAHVSSAEHALVQARVSLSLLVSALER